MVEVGDLAVEPQVDTGDGCGLKVGELLAQGCGFRSLGQDAVEIFEGQSEDKVVKEFVFLGRANSDLRGLGGESFEGGAEADFSAAGADVVSGAVVEVSQRDGGNAHVAGFGGLHGFADNLGGVGDGDEVEVFAESADQDGLPEALDGVGSLSVAMAPVEKGLASIGLTLKD